MLRPDLTAPSGIGSGRFEDYFVEDLIPHIDSIYRTLPERAQRGIDGFSIGGNTALVLSFLHPGLYSSVGSYDGTVMWYNLDDPETAGNMPDDHLWVSEESDPFIGPMFDIPRDIDYMLLHSPIKILMEADAAKIDSIRSTRYHIHAVHDDSVGNLSRNVQLLDSMATKGITNTFDEVILTPDAKSRHCSRTASASRLLPLTITTKSSA